MSESHEKRPERPSDDLWPAPQRDGAEAGNAEAGNAEAGNAETGSAETGSAARRIRSARMNEALDLWDELSLNGKLTIEQFARRYPDIEESIIKTVAYLGSFAGEPRADSWPKPGQTRKQFRILEELGRGAVARVYLAEQTDVDHRLVAVKVSPRHVWGRQFISSNEAHVQGRLDHPNIVPVLTTQREGDFHFICMPYEGWATVADVTDHCFVKSEAPPASAARLLDASRDRRLPPAADHGQLGRAYPEGVARLGCDIARALDYVHSQGVHHGDLKPTNVLVTPGGRAMLIDFNLSACEELAIDCCGGTLPYLAPERLASIGQLAPEPAPPAAEVFSCGLILWELMTGAHPFKMPAATGRAAPPQRIAAELLQAARAPLPQGRLHEQSDDTLDALIRRCLSPAPARRPTAGELAEQLEAWLHSRRKADATQRPAAPSRPRGRRRRRASALWIALGIAALLLVAWGGWSQNFFRIGIARRPGRLLALGVGMLPPKPAGISGGESRPDPFVVNAERVRNRIAAEYWGTVAAPPELAEPTHWRNQLAFRFEHEGDRESGEWAAFMGAEMGGFDAAQAFLEKLEAEEGPWSDASRANLATLRLQSAESFGPAKAELERLAASTELWEVKLNLALALLLEARENRTAQPKPMRERVLQLVADAAGAPDITRWGLVLAAELARQGGDSEQGRRLDERAASLADLSMDQRRVAGDVRHKRRTVNPLSAASAHFAAPPDLRSPPTRPTR